MEGGGKMGYGGGGGQHETARLLKALSRTVEPRNFGIGLVAGFLLVTCAYFSTANFDAIHIALMPSKNGIGSPLTAFDGSGHRLGPDLGAQDPEDALSKQGSKAEVLDTDDEFSRKMNLPASSGPDASMGDTGKEGEAFPGAPPNATAEGGGTLLPPLSSPEESTNSTQEQGVLEDEELQVQDAMAAAAANASKKISGGSNGSSSPASVIQSDPATIPAPAQQIPTPQLEVKAPPVEQIPPTPVQQQEVKATPVQLIPPTPEVKQTGSSSSEAAAARRRPWKPLCDFASNRRIDWCELDGDVRVHGANGTVTLVDAAMAAEEWRVKPYPRKADASAMRFVREITVRSTPPNSANAAPACTERHEGVPALVFSDRGYTGNYFHAYTDVILPLFLTARQYSGEVQFMVSDFQMWWIGKFMPVFKSLSNYPLIDLAADSRVHCFKHVQVGLTCHADFSIDPSRSPNGYSMVDFTKFMRQTYKLPRDLAAPINGARPRLLIIARARTRRFDNLAEIVRGAEKVGFEAVVSEGDHEVAPFAELSNTCDVMLGVHGAGLTNMIFLPTGGAVIQVVPLGGLEFVAGYFRGPAADMGLRYLEYRIAPAESSLSEQYPPDHPVFTDPEGVKSKGWDSLKEAYLDKQDVKLDMRRFRPLLKKAFAHVRANKKLQ